MGRIYNCEDPCKYTEEEEEGEEAPPPSSFHRNVQSFGRHEEEDKPERSTYWKADKSLSPYQPFPVCSKWANEVDRLRTFKHWPKKFYISPVTMAVHGFYTNEKVAVGGYKDAVRCFACDFMWWKWDPDCDTAWREHINESPHCPMVTFGYDHYQYNNPATPSLRESEMSALFARPVRY